MYSYKECNPESAKYNRQKQNTWRAESKILIYSFITIPNSASPQLGIFWKL